MSKQDTKSFSQRDVLAIEVEPFIDNYVLFNADNLPVILSSKTKTVVEIMGSQFFDVERDVEENLDDWKEAVRWEARQLEAAKKAVLQDEPSLTEDQVTKFASILVYGNYKNAPSRFLDSVGRPRKALKSLKILENKGPRANDPQALLEKKSHLDDLMKEALLKLLQNNQQTPTTVEAVKDQSKPTKDE